MSRGKGLSREVVAKAALAVADAEGTSAVTMRRVGRECGVEAMSLYVYVNSSRDLWLAMVAERHGEQTARWLSERLADEDKPTRDLLILVAKMFVAVEDPDFAGRLLDLVSEVLP